MNKIIHIDADCFFAALELRESPLLVGQPLAVGGDPQKRGVIATCNYLARNYGVRSAMPSHQALRLCPELKILPPRMAFYREVSQQMYEIFRGYSDKVERLSLDEAYLDVSDSRHCGGSATLIARDIRAQVNSTLGITVSAGVAPLKFLAKIASDWHKPDGLFVIPPNRVLPFLADLPLRSLPGVGAVTASKLARHGLYCCADINAWGVDKLHHHFGSVGSHIFRLASGIDERDVCERDGRKSLSVETTYPSDIAGYSELSARLPALIEKLQQRHGQVAQRFAIAKRFVKLRFSDFTSTTLEAPVGSSGALFAFADYQRLVSCAWSRKCQPVRLLGLGLKLVDCRASPQQLPLPLPLP